MKNLSDLANDSNNHAQQLAAVLNAAAKIVESKGWKAPAYAAVGIMYHTFSHELPRIITKCLATRILGGGNIKGDLFNFLTNGASQKEEIQTLTGELLAFNVASSAAMLNDHLRSSGLPPIPELDTFIDNCLNPKSERSNDNAV